MTGNAQGERPRRIQRKRTKGWKMPENTVYVGRGTMWGNYASLRLGLTKGQVAVDLFRDWVRNEASRDWKAAVKRDLRGKTLCCWCGENEPCHADVLLDLANSRGRDG